jgi:hypothetical protein
VPGRGIVPRMQGIAVQLLAQVRVAEGWSAGNVLGAVLLLALLLGALWAVVLVGRRR